MFAQNTAGWSVGTSVATLFSGSAVTFDGTSRYCVEFDAPNVNIPGGGAGMFIYLYDGSTAAGYLDYEFTASGQATYAHPVNLKTCRVFSSGSHTLGIRANVSSGSVAINCGDGAAGNISPCYMRITHETASGASTLAGLSDVDTTGRITGSVLKYDSGVSKWVVGVDATGGGGGTYTGPSSGDLENATKWGIYAVAMFLGFVVTVYGLTRLSRGAFGKIATDGE